MDITERKITKIARFCMRRMPSRCEMGWNVSLPQASWYRATW